jgi:DNA repair ATPase RecN
MSEEENVEHDQAAAVSEQPIGDSQEDQIDGQKTVPLSAMIATRKKAQDESSRADKAEAKAQMLEAYINKMQAAKQEPEEEEDPRAIVERKDLHENTAHTKRDILETLYQDMNPEAVQKINKYLKPILEKKPWLASSVDTAQNRYARAYEIVQDYLHLVEEKPQVRQSSNVDGQRIVQNSQKPRSPVEVGKSARPEGMEYLKSIQGKKEFREYRQKVLRGEA